MPPHPHSARTRLLAQFLPLALLLGARPGSADDVVLTGGTRLEGVVLERGAERVRLLLPAGDELSLAAADVREIVADADAPSGDKLVRYTSGPKAAREGLEVALVHLVHPTSGRRVDLVGAVHIADMGYYREVQRLLEDDDVVLYEMVKPQEPRPEEASEDENPLRAFQQKLARWFGFAFQLDGISYDRPHFIHADMTMEEFSAAAEASNDPADPQAPAPGSAPEGATPETPAGRGKLTLPGPLGAAEGQIHMLETLLQGMGIDDPTRGPQVRRTVKMFMGRMLGAMGTKIGALLGAEATELLLTKRNAIVIERLKELPESARSVGIFYGVAHLPDLEQRLLALGYARVGARWLLAWDAKKP